MLDKRLQLGGLQVGGPRTMQNSARFRIADNVYQTLDEYMVPRFGNKTYLSGLPTDHFVVAVASYQLKPFVITRSGDNKLHFYYDSAVVLPSDASVPTIVFPNPDDVLSLGFQFAETRSCLFFNMPILGLFKFDGVQVYRAGVPTPSINSAQYADAGATFVRAIQHHIDFQGNVVNSGYLQFPATPVANIVNIRTDGNGLDMMSTFFTSFYNNVTPKGRQDFDILAAGSDNFYVVASALASSDASGFTLTTGGNHRVVVGAYIILSPFYQPTYGSGFGVETYCTAFKVASFTATTVTFQYADGRYLDTSRTWNTDLASTPALTFPLVMCNYWQSIWTSNVSTGNYVWKALIPVPFYSTTAQTFAVDVSSPTVPATGVTKNAFNLAGNLGDIYDVTSFKFPFPAFLSDRPSLSFCTYGDMALLAQVSDVYFSDTTLGGSFEMTSGIAFVTIGGGNDGPIQAIQGAPDFFLVSRQFKNYYVAGNLPTANYRVQAIPQTSLGVYSNEATVGCLDKVIFVNKTGVWALYSGGRCEEVSFNVRGLFDTFSDTNQYPEETYFDISGYPTYIVPSQQFAGTSLAYNKWIKVRYDVSRNLVFIIAAGSNKRGNFLVLNMNNGEMYTWNDVLYAVPNPKFTDICFIEGNYYISNNSDNGHAVNKEEKTDLTYKYDYMAGTFPPTLATTWFTAGEPSLEKKVNQLKMWGLIEGSIEMHQFVDWRTPASTETNYINSDVGLFSHKKRLEGNNCLSVSVEMVIRATRFELEGLELEFNPFQLGMKR